VSLADRTNSANADQLTTILRRTIPGYDGIVSQYTKNLGQELQGQLPSDVADNIMRTTAERGVAGGFSGGGTFRTNLTARDFGLTQLDISRKAMDRVLPFLSTMKSVSTPQLMGVQDSFISPQQRIEQDNRNSLGVFQAQSAQAQENAKPNPMLSSLAGFTSQIGGTLFGYGMQDWSTNRNADRQAERAAAIYSSSEGDFNQRLSNLRSLSKKRP